MSQTVLFIFYLYLFSSLCNLFTVFTAEIWQLKFIIFSVVFVDYNVISYRIIILKHKHCRAWK
jgi:hypothetical protein